jgi:hypothetical protein
MRLDAIAIGNNPPLDINVIIEVPVGGEPIKRQLNRTRLVFHLLGLDGRCGHDGSEDQGEDRGDGHGG